MKVILLEELRGKGGEGDVIDVADGFANNYLLRQGIAIPATKGNMKQLEQRRNNIAKREVSRISNAEKLKETLEGTKIYIDARVGDEGQLFGSITATMIADAVQQQLGAEIDRRRIELGSPIKKAGEHKVLVSLYREIKAELDLMVGVAEEAEEVAEEIAEETDEIVEVIEEVVVVEEDAE